MAAVHSGRRRLSSGKPTRSSQLLALENSIMTVSSQGNIQLPGTDQATKSALGFMDANKGAVKDSVKRQKQAWVSPPDTPPSPRQQQSSPPQKGIEKVQDFLYPEHLEKLKEKFQDSSGNVVGEIDLDEFIQFFKKFPELKKKSDQDIKTFFDKIDCYSEGKIDWDSFCTYMYLELYEKEDAKTKAKEVNFQLPATPISGPHRDSLCRLCYLQDGSVVSCSQDGTICFWTHKLKPKRKRKAETGTLGKPKWISDMALAPAHGKIILATGDNEIQFFEMINFEPYCQIANLEFTPLKVFFWSCPSNKNESVLLVGDEQGTVTIFCIPHLPEAFKLWKAGPKKKGMPTFLLDRLVLEDDVADIKVYRWKVHADWVTDLKYFGQLRVFASSACDSTSSLLMGSPSGSTPVEAILRKNPFSKRPGFRPTVASIGGRQVILQAKHRLPGDQKVFKVNKGVSSFDYCHISNVLVTGGMDQVIRLWNPFVTTSPVGVLYGHGSPIFSIKLDSHNERIYSISNDNTLKAWDIVEQNCLGTAYTAAHKVNLPIEAMLFNPISQSVILATEQLYHIPLLIIGDIRGSARDQVHTHRQPITTLNYSDAFGLVISTSAGSDVKVWSVSNGECVFEFASLHRDACITAADVDASGKRLVTAAINGEIKIWNFNNGHCLLTLDKGNNDEVCSIKFVSVNQIKYVVAVGWDKQINVFSDTSNCENVHSVVFPLSSWIMSSSRAHKEDITAVELILPNLLATASFDGEIVLWNIISGYITNRIKPPVKLGSLKSLSTAEGDYVITKLLCMDKRQYKQGVFVVASGPAGFVHFWNHRDCRQPAGYFEATNTMRITDMATDSLNNTLVTSDTRGFVCVWNIEKYFYTMSQGNTSPTCVVKWRAHRTLVRSLLLVESQSLLLTGSEDCSVRVWTMEGHYVGTLGQPSPWFIGSAHTYQYPMGPKDVMPDPESVSDLENEPLNDSDSESEKVFTDHLLIKHSQSSNDDEDILSKHGLSFKVPTVDERTKSAGKRLRHLRMNSAKSAARGYEPPAGSYASLLFQDLEKEPIIELKTDHQSSMGKSLRM